MAARQRSTRRDLFAGTVVLAALLLGAVHQACAQTIPGALSPTQAALQRGEWPVYAGTNGSLRYSPLDVIQKSNASKLKVLWRWRSPDNDLRAAGLNVATSFT